MEVSRKQRQRGGKKESLREIYNNLIISKQRTCSFKIGKTCPYLTATTRVYITHNIRPGPTTAVTSARMKEAWGETGRTEDGTWSRREGEIAAGCLQVALAARSIL
ncbi:hypothetical protein PoB_004801000 [Plakobranchus ocellatus]|uniref:Uncharacterized protein n=1 Tax=Plakobranchus ocellatus TaxID=259542 RepID=A0AAV4BLT6_9GAST|nr:hypothetical protein PoB_004801000 [Plakobranchus ocellatus]